VRVGLTGGGVAEAAQYFVGLLGALVVLQQVWALLLLALPTVLVYLAFQHELDHLDGRLLISVLDKDQAFLTADLRVEFLRSARVGTLTARGWVVRRTRRVVFCAAGMRAKKRSCAIQFASRNSRPVSSPAASRSMPASFGSSASSANVRRLTSDECPSTRTSIASRSPKTRSSGSAVAIAPSSQRDSS